MKRYLNHTARAILQQLQVGSIRNDLVGYLDDTCMTAKDNLNRERATILARSLTRWGNAGCPIEPTGDEDESKGYQLDPRMLRAQSQRLSTHPGAIAVLMILRTLVDVENIITGGREVEFEIDISGPLLDEWEMQHYPLHQDSPDPVVTRYPTRIQLLFWGS